MKKKLLFLFASMLMSISMAHADTKDAIYVWVNGTSTCYKISGIPQVNYTDNSVVITLSGKTTPELTIPVASGEEVSVVYGTYQATGIENVNADSKVTRNGKFITGGKLVVVKDGKQYDEKGVLIK